MAEQPRGVPADPEAFVRKTYGRAGAADPSLHPPAAPHLLIRASAGTGKTYRLTTRYLRLLRAGETAEHILATTFTRKAAGEVLERVLGGLARAAIDVDERARLDEAIGGFGLSGDDCIAMLRRLVDGMHRLGIGTIDSFFNRAARAMRFELDLPAEPRIADEGGPLARELRYDAIQAVLGDAAATDDGFQSLIELLRRVHHDTARRSVTEAIDDLVAGLYEVYRQVPEHAKWSVLDAPPTLSAELLQVAVQGFVSLGDAIPQTKTGKPRAAWVKAHQALCDAALRGDFDAVLGHLLSQRALVDDAEAEYSGSPIPEDWRAGLMPLLSHARALAVRQLAHQTEATYALLHAFTDHYEQAKRSAGVLMFSDLTHLLAGHLPALGEDATREFYYRMDTRVTHLLLDEFQDTSRTQWSVLAPFAEEVTAVDSGERSLFCVGDEKQAIYGWRGGCAELFSAVELLPGVEPWTMTQSRRSSPVVLDAVNRVFSTLADNEALKDKESRWDPVVAQWADRFEEHTAFHQDLPGHVLLKTTAPNPSDGSSEGFDQDDDDEDGGAASIATPHELACAEHIAALVAASPGHSIGVLVRRKKAARGLLHRLRSMGVAVSEEGGNPIDHTPAVSAVLAAVRLADHPGDGVAAFHVANSPLGEAVGLRDASPGLAARLAPQIRRQILDRGFGETVANWCRSVAPSCDARSLRRLEQLVTLAQAYDREIEQGGGASSLRVSGFVDYVRQARVESPTPAAVRVMTLHAAKGLEFDAVVLPDLSAVLSKTDARSQVLLDRDSPLDEPRAVVRRVKRDRLKAVGLEHLADREDALQRGEDLCLLYVGMTRARHALHLLVPPLKPTKGGVSSAGRTDLSFAAILRQALAPEADEGMVGNELLLELGRPDWPSKRRKEEPAAHTPRVSIRLAGTTTPTRSRPEQRPSDGGDGATVRAEDLLKRSNPGGRSFGTAMHAACETLGFVDEEGTPTRDTVAAALRAAGLPHAADDAERFAQLIRRLLDAPVVAEVLSRNGAAELWRERSFAALVDGRLMRGVFDRVHLWRDEEDAPTRALLIDFKTDRLSEGGPAEIAEHYRAQMAAYRGALSAMLGLDMAAIEAVLVLTGEALVVPVE